MLAPRPALALAALASLLTLNAPARAQESLHTTTFRGRSAPRPPPPIPAAEGVWDPAWPGIHPAEYVATGVAAVGLGVAYALRPNAHPSAQTNAFDEAGRDGIRFSRESDRIGARSASDLLFALNISYPVLVVPLLGEARGRMSPTIFWRMTWINAEVLAINGLFQTAVATLVGRERPYGRTCGEGLRATTKECTGNDRYRSFFSGHTSFSFAAAGLACSHHQNLHILGRDGDVLACATNMLAAAATGWARVAGDRHYLSDVLVGAAFGSALGLGLPWLLHYRGKAAPAPSTKREQKAPKASWTIAPGPMGAAVIGSF